MLRVVGTGVFGFAIDADARTVRFFNAGATTTARAIGFTGDIYISLGCDNTSYLGGVTLNAGQNTREITVANTGDRPVQVGSHYHFFETNPALAFDRAAARGMRLDIAPGTAVRFEPGQTRTVALVPLRGSQTVYGFRGDVMGKL